MQILGQATIDLDGQTLVTEESSARLTVGGKLGTTRNGPEGPVGASYSTRSSSLSFSMLPTADVDIEQFRQAKVLSYSFIGDNGLTYTVSEAWVTEIGEITTGDGAAIPITLEGKPAQKV